MHQTDLFDVEGTIAPKAQSDDRFAALAPADLSDGEKDSIIQLALRVLEPAVRYQVFTDVETTKRYLQLRFAREPNELFACAYLDTRHRLIELAELFHGTIDGCSVHPRVVAQRALAVGASACIIAQPSKRRSNPEHGGHPHHPSHPGSARAARHPPPRPHRRRPRGRRLTRRTRGPMTWPGSPSPPTAPPGSKASSPASNGPMTALSPSCPWIRMDRPQC